MSLRPPSQQGPSSPSEESHADSLAENLQHLSFSTPDKRSRAASAKRKYKKPCPEELEEARQRTIYVSDLNKGITETELVRWFGVAGHVLECRICSDMNTSKRFAFVEFADKNGFDAGTCFLCELVHMATYGLMHFSCACFHPCIACRLGHERREAQWRCYQSVTKQDSHCADQP